MTRRPLDDDDLLEEILLRLPPSPSSLPRASLVCARWRGIVSDPEFLRRFRGHHRKPPLLGLFAPESAPGASAFSPALDPPDHIPPERFPAPDDDDSWEVLGCRHGLAVLANVLRRVILVWDPLTGRQRRVAFPPGLGSPPWVIYRQAAVLCAEAEEGHTHGNCFSSPLKLVMVWVVESTRARACVYESATGVWGDIVCTKITCQFFGIKPAILVGNALCWCLSGGDTLTFSLETRSLGVIKPPLLSPLTDLRYGMVQLFRTEDSGLGFAHLLAHTMKLWVMETSCEGISRWVFLQTFQLEELFLQGTLCGRCEWARMTGYDEDTNGIILSTAIGDFTFQVDTSEINHIIKRNGRGRHAYHPYRNFYTAGSAVGLKRLDLKVRTPEMC